MIQFIFILILLNTLKSFSLENQCDDIPVFNPKTKFDCQQRGGCKWECESSQSCNYIQDCLSVDSLFRYCDERFCKKTLFPQTCALIRNICMLNEDNSSCNYPKSCRFIEGKEATCKPKESFGCNKLSQNECQNFIYCIWQVNSCQTSNKCQNLTINDCQINKSYCSSQIKNCKETSGASQACIQNTTKNSCEEDYCKWNDQDKICTPPKCEVLYDDKGQSYCLNNLCEVDQFTCSDLKNICDYSSFDDCKNKSQSFCKWEDSKCIDNNQYCQLNTCQNQLEQCDYSPETYSDCINNNKDNECINLEEDQCKSKEQCFEAQSWLCDFYSDCRLFNENICKNKDGCQWSNYCYCVKRPLNSILLSFGYSTLILLLMI